MLIRTSKGFGPACGLSGRTVGSGLCGLWMVATFPLLFQFYFNKLFLFHTIYLEIKITGRICNCKDQGRQTFYKFSERISLQIDIVNVNVSHGDGVAPIMSPGCHLPQIGQCFLHGSTLDIASTQVWCGHYWYC